jgi:hypothetical protein
MARCAESAAVLAMHRLERVSRIDHVVYKKHAVSQSWRGHRHVLGDDELAAHLATLRGVRMRRQDRQRQLG